jgi:FtsP/CotA-like multicopper oxidase with cupredoxin domain
MDGAGGLNQPHIPPGKTFVYEFEMTKSGTFMYHPHADETLQMADGNDGFIVVHPKNPKAMAAGTEVRTLARGDHRCGRRPDARARVPG